jgi:hypothetical protein
MRFWRGTDRVFAEGETPTWADAVERKTRIRRLDRTVRTLTPSKCGATADKKVKRVTLKLPVDQEQALLEKRLPPGLPIYSHHKNVKISKGVIMRAYGPEI